MRDEGLRFGFFGVKGLLRTFPFLVVAFCFCGTGFVGFARECFRGVEFLGVVLFASTLFCSFAGLFFFAFAFPVLMSETRGLHPDLVLGM